LAENLIDRAAAAGFRAIVLTVDQPVYGSSPRAARAPLRASPDIRNANLPGQPIAQHSYKAR
jgi:isopentenyl diphosphate isomerase/L-lactate dehydrogenase-like FMN-dependent dehydrogenase